MEDIIENINKNHENIHERTTFSSQIDFEFLVSSVSLFDAEMYY